MRAPARLFVILVVSSLGFFLVLSRTSHDPLSSDTVSSWSSRFNPIRQRWQSAYAQTHLGTKVPSAVTHKTHGDDLSQEVGSEKLLSGNGKDKDVAYTGAESASTSLTGNKDSSAGNSAASLAAESKDADRDATRGFTDKEQAEALARLGIKPSDDDSDNVPSDKSSKKSSDSASSGKSSSTTTTTTTTTKKGSKTSEGKYPDADDDDDIEDAVDTGPGKPAAWTDGPTTSTSTTEWEGQPTATIDKEKGKALEIMEDMFGEEAPSAKSDKEKAEETGEVGWRTTGTWGFVTSTKKVASLITSDSEASLTSGASESTATAASDVDADATGTAKTGTAATSTTYTSKTTAAPTAGRRPGSDIDTPDTGRTGAEDKEAYEYLSELVNGPPSTTLETDTSSTTESTSTSTSTSASNTEDINNRKSPQNRKQLPLTKDRILSKANNPSPGSNKDTSSEDGATESPMSIEHFSDADVLLGKDRDNAGLKAQPGGRGRRVGGDGAKSGSSSANGDEEKIYDSKKTNNKTDDDRESSEPVLIPSSAHSRPSRPSRKGSIRPSKDTTAKAMASDDDDDDKVSSSTSSTSKSNSNSKSSSSKSSSSSKTQAEQGNQGTREEKRKEAAAGESPTAARAHMERLPKREPVAALGPKGARSRAPPEVRRRGVR